MSMIRQALRSIVVMAIKGRTESGDDVFDSDSQTIGEMVADTQKPIVSVYTEEDQEKNGSRFINVIIESTIVRAVREDVYRDKAGNVLFPEDVEEGQQDNLVKSNEVVIRKPTTDLLLEYSLEKHQSRIKHALLGQNEHAEALKEFIVGGKIEFVSSQRAVSDKNEPNRYAARQIFMQMKVMPDLPKYQPQLKRIFEMMLLDDDYSFIAQDALNFELENMENITQFDLDTYLLRLPKKTAQLIRI